MAVPQVPPTETLVDRTPAREGKVHPAAARTPAPPVSTPPVRAPDAPDDTPPTKGVRARHAPIDRPWVAAMARAALRTLARVPLPILHVGGAVIGRIASALPTAMRHISHVNLEFCLPDETPAKRRDLEKRSLEHLGRAALELPVFWAADRQGIQGLVRKIHGQQYLDAARASGKGTLLASPHLGAWEFLGLWFSTLHKTVGLYRRPRIKQFDTVTLGGRCRFKGTMLEASRSSLRELMRSLRRDECVWMMVDQVPAKGAGVWAPFFGKPALTGTLLPRLVASTGAAVVWAYARRLPRGQGFDIHLFPADEDIGSMETEDAVAAVNRNAERVIRECPEQYLWRYKRFRRTSDGSPSPYK